MRKPGVLFLLALSAASVSGPALAATYECVAASTPYCTYTGKVRQVYVNRSDAILIYFESGVNLVSAATTAGFSGVSSGDAGIVQISDNSDYAKFLYSTALTAKSTNTEVSFVLKGAYQGYLYIDKLWLMEK